MSSEDMETELVASIREHKTVQWKIKDFINAINRNSVFSPKFAFAKTVFFLEVAKPTLENVDDLSIALFLHANNDLLTSEEIYYTMGIQKPDASIFKSIKGVVSYCNSDVGKEDFLKRFSHVQHNVVATDGSLTFFCTLIGGERKEAAFLEGLANENTEVAAPPENVVNLFEAFRELNISGLHSDVKIKVEDREFQSHRCILSIRSPVFASMFQHEMAEKSSGVVDITDCNAHCFEAFLLFLYTGDVSHVALDNALGLYKLAEKYQMRDLKEECAQFLKAHLRAEMICDVIHLAVVHDEAELLVLATDFFIINSNRVLTTNRWKEFLVESPAMANELFIQMANNHCRRK